MEFLESVSDNPLAYSFIFFIYSILAVVFLPIPVELGLVWGSVNFTVKALILGSGKAVGSILVFYIGVRVEDDIRAWSSRFSWIEKFVRMTGTFVERYGYYALYIILSIPFMVDTLPLYFFSIFNKEGRAMERKRFVLVNFLGGVTRAFLIYLIFHTLGIWAIR